MIGTELTAAIVARLVDQTDGFVVEEFPDDPSRYTFAPKRPTLLVGYERSSYREPESMQPLSQARDVEVSVTLLVRSLRGPSGAGAAIEAVRLALLGWQPGPGGRPMIMLRDELVGHEDGVWRFAITLQTSTVVVENAAERTGPAFTQLVLKPSEEGCGC